MPRAKRAQVSRPWPLPPPRARTKPGSIRPIPGSGRSAEREAVGGLVVVVPVLVVVAAGIVVAVAVAVAAIAARSRSPPEPPGGRHSPCGRFSDLTPPSAVWGFWSGQRSRQLPAVATRTSAPACGESWRECVVLCCVCVVFVCTVCKTAAGNAMQRYGMQQQPPPVWQCRVGSLEFWLCRRP